MFPSPTPLRDGVRAAGAEALAALVLRGLSLALLVQRAHWAVRGPGFLPFHKFFGDVYEGIGDANDRLAERAATLGCEDAMGAALSVPVPTLSTRDGLQLSAMLADALFDYVKAVYEAYARVDEMGLVADANALQSVAEDVEKLGWMLKSHTIAG